MQRDDLGFRADQQMAVIDAAQALRRFDGGIRRWLGGGQINEAQLIVGR